MSLKSKFLPNLRGTADWRANPSDAQTSRPAPDDLPSELADWFAICPLPLLLCAADGRILAQNPPMQAVVGPQASTLGSLAPAVCALIGWPDAMPAAGVTVQAEAWWPQDGGSKSRWRVSVRGLASGRSRRWLVQFEDCRLEDDRDLAQIEIAALMGTAGLGVATFDPERGWVTAAQPRSASARGAGEGGIGSVSQGLMSIGRDLVEPESLPDYERLQAALRRRERIEVRYAVRHREIGRRWLLTRVEPADLPSGRAAFSVVTLDVTEEENARRRNEQLLHELGTILDLSPAGIGYLRRHTLVRCNARFEALLGLAPGDGAGLGIAELLERCGVAGAAADTARISLAERGSFEAEFQHGGAGSGGAWLSLALRRAATEGGDTSADKSAAKSSATSADPSDGLEDIVALLSDVSRLRAQQAEMEGLERDRELMFSLSDVGIVYQRDGRIERANQAMAELTGYSQQALHGLPLAELHEDPRSYQIHAAQELRELNLSGRARGERRIRRRDGSPLWVQVSQRPVDLADLAQGTISSFVSVDERRRARESLLVQADRTRAILDSVLVGIITVGERGIEWMNRSARRMFGGELADFIDLPISEVATREPEHPLRRTDWLATLLEGQAETFECRLMARDGREFWVVGNVVVTGRETGASQLTFALLDIERRREAEHQIAQARASLQRIIETAPLAIALFDAEQQQVLQLNQMMSAFARRPAAEIQGRQPAAWLPAPEAAALAADLRRALASQEMVRSELHRAADPDSGEPARVWDVRIVSLAGSGDAGAQALLVASDVTEQRAADEARLEAAIAQREMLIREVHHRIKNNLQGVAGLLQQSAERNPETGGAIAEAVGQVHAIAQVHGLQVGITGPLRVRGVMEAIASSVQRMFGRPITVAVEGPAPHRFGLTEADSIPIALTVNELLTNAIKHSATTHGPIACRMVCSTDEVSLCVVNEGRLVAGFSLAQVPSGISGLGLVRALLPRKGAQISLEQDGPRVVARLRLTPPAVAVLEPL